MNSAVPPVRSAAVTPAEYARLRQLPGCLVYHSGVALAGSDPKPLVAVYRRPATGELYIVVEHHRRLSIRCFSTRRREGLSPADLEHAAAVADEMARSS